MAKRKLPRGKMKGAQRGSAVKVKGYSRNGKRVQGYKRGKPGGKKG